MKSNLRFIQFLAERVAELNGWHRKVLALTAFSSMMSSKAVKSTPFTPPSNSLISSTVSLWFNSFPPSTAYMCRQTVSALVHALAWRWQAITWTNADLLSIGPIGTKFSENRIEILTVSFQKMHLKIFSGKWWPFCPGGDELTKKPLTDLLCRGHAIIYS